jgi:hypothetical protein
VLLNSCCATECHFSQVHTQLHAHAAACTRQTFVCVLPHCRSYLHCSLKSLVVEIIPNTLEKIFPLGDPTIKDYAAARRIPCLVVFGQLALPLLFQWVGVACTEDRASHNANQLHIQIHIRIQ